jgi:inner membrane protein
VSCLAGFASHCLLDACTSYGTPLLWPFSRERIAFDIVSAVDPLLTLPLLGLVAYGVWSRRAIFALIGISFCLVYLGAGSLQQGRAHRAAMELAAGRGHVPEHIEIKPSLGNILLWRSIYEAAGEFHIDGVRVGIGTRIYEGVRVPRLEVARDFPWLGPELEQWRDVQRFSRFASGYLALDATNRNRIVDIRYSLVPNQFGGFWGIALDPTFARDAHAAYVTMRVRPLAEGRELMAMLFQGETVE